MPDRRRVKIGRVLKAHVREAYIASVEVDRRETEASTRTAVWVRLAIYMALFLPFVVIELGGALWRHGYFEWETFSETVHRLELAGPRWVRWTVALTIWVFFGWLGLHLGFDWPF